MSLPEIQRALKLYGMAPLYARTDRDAVLIIALNNGRTDMPAVNRLLVRHGMEPLAACGAAMRYKSAVDHEKP